VLERLQNSKGPFVLFGRDEEIDRDKDIEGTDEVTTIPNSLDVCDEWWLFRSHEPFRQLSGIL
jgi:hypothetical protein